MKRLALAILCAALFHLWGCTQTQTDSVPLKTVNADDLKNTVVTLDLNQPIVEGQNVVWCASFQLAWNELMDFSGGPIEMNPQLPIADELNKRLIDKSFVPPGGVVADAGVVGEGVIERIKARLDEVFGEAAQPELLQEADAFPPDSVIMYAYLYRDMPFKYQFDDVTTGFSSEFNPPVGDGDDAEKEHAKSYGAFGLKKTSEIYDRSRNRIRDQVRVIWYDIVVLKDATTKDGHDSYDYDDYDEADAAVYRQDFIIELLTESKEDRLILACLPPGKTLLDTVAIIMGHLAKPNTAVPEIPKEFESEEAA